LAGDTATPFRKQLMSWKNYRWQNEVLESEGQGATGTAALRRPQSALTLSPIRASGMPSIFDRAFKGES
jgi:hypothetical protein